MHEKKWIRKGDDGGGFVSCAQSCGGFVGKWEGKKELSNSSEKLSREDGWLSLL